LYCGLPLYDVQTCPRLAEPFPWRVRAQMDRTRSRP
jgi:hypothetical protein